MEQQWTVRGLTAHANHLVTALDAVEDTRNEARQRRTELVANVNALVKAWNILSRNLQGPQLQQRQAFHDTLRQIISDNVIIISHFRNELTDLRNTQQRARRISRFVSGHDHPLVKLFGRQGTQLKEKQIAYTIAVLELILAVVLYAKAQGHRHDTPEEIEEAREEQDAAIRGEFDTKIDVTEEESTRGNTVISSMWLSTVTSHTNSAEDLPLARVAFDWFQVALPQRNDRHSHANEQHILHEVRQLREEIQRHEQLHRQHADFRARAEGTIRQVISDQQEAAQVAAATIAELRAQLDGQRRTIQADANLIERLRNDYTQLKHSRDQWNDHFNRQNTKVQRLEGQVTALKGKCKSLEQSQAKLERQNETLRQQLRTSEDQNAKAGQQRQEALQSKQRWKDRYATSQSNHVTQINQMQEQLDKFRKEAAELRKEVDKISNEKDKEHIRAERFRERLASRKPDCPTSYDNNVHHRSSRSKTRSERSGAASPSREHLSRSSSFTLNDDSALEHTNMQPEYAERECAPVRSPSTASSSRASSWTYVNSSGNGRESVLLKGFHNTTNPRSSDGDSKSSVINDGASDYAHYFDQLPAKAKKVSISGTWNSLQQPPPKVSLHKVPTNRSHKHSIALFRT